MILHLKLHAIMSLRTFRWASSINPIAQRRNNISPMRHRWGRKQLGSGGLTRSGMYPLPVFFLFCCGMWELIRCGGGQRRLGAQIITDAIGACGRQNVKSGFHPYKDSSFGRHPFSDFFWFYLSLEMIYLTAALSNKRGWSAADCLTLKYRSAERLGC